MCAEEDTRIKKTGRVYLSSRTLRETQIKSTVAGICRIGHNVRSPYVRTFNFSTTVHRIGTRLFNCCKNITGLIASTSNDLALREAGMHQFKFVLNYAT